MRRRLFVAASAASAVWEAGGTIAQQQSRPFRIGILSPAQQSTTKMFDIFRGRMRDLGHVEGRTVVYEYRLGAGSAGSPVDMATSLVRLPVDVIVTDGGLRIAQAAQEATRTIPIVMATAPGDPVGAGLAASLARPGGNATGFTLLSVDLPPKRLELIREIVPGARHLLAIWDPISGPQGRVSVEQAANQRSLQLKIVEITEPAEIAPRIAVGLDGTTDAVMVIPSAMFWNRRQQVLATLAKSRVPAIFPEREYADDGGLLAYGTDVEDNFRGAAEYVDKILKGSKPADLPIVQPKKFLLVVNLRTARALGIIIPPSILARADEVID